MAAATSEEIAKDPFKHLLAQLLGAAWLLDPRSRARA